MNRTLFAVMAVLAACAFSDTSVQKDVEPLGHIKLAGGCPDACKWNYDQCMKGCAGATSCSDQCQRNYEGCISGCR